MVSLHCTLDLILDLIMSIRGYHNFLTYSMDICCLCCKGLSRNDSRRRLGLRSSEIFIPNSVQAVDFIQEGEAVLVKKIYSEIITTLNLFVLLVFQMGAIFGEILLIFIYLTELRVVSRMSLMQRLCMMTLLSLTWFKLLWMSSVSTYFIHRNPHHIILLHTTTE